MTSSQGAKGDAAPAAILRLLRLLSRRRAGIADVHRFADPGGAQLPVAAASGQLGLIATDEWRAAFELGFVRVGDDGIGRIAPAGLLALRRHASAAGGGAMAAATPTSPREADYPSPQSAIPSCESANGATAEPGFNCDESPLAWLARRRDKSGRPMIDSREFEAGERFRADFHFAQMTPRVTANWSLDTSGGGRRRGGAPGMVALCDNVVAAQERVRRALAVVGPELAGVLVDVCGHLKGLEHAERRAGWPARSGKVVLQLALQALARHYGLKGEPRAVSRQWGAEDYRPRIDG